MTNLEKMLKTANQNLIRMNRLIISLKRQLKEAREIRDDAAEDVMKIQEAIRDAEISESANWKD
jgi:precorrin-6B methylase 1